MRLLSVQPFEEHGRDGQRQAEQLPVRRPCSRLLRRLEDGWDLAVVDAGNHRGDQHAHRHACLPQGFHGSQPGLGSRCPRFHRAGEVGVEGGDADADMEDGLGGHLVEEIEVARHQSGFGDDAHRLVCLGGDLQASAGQAEVCFEMRKTPLFFVVSAYSSGRIQGFSTISKQTLRTCAPGLSSLPARRISQRDCHRPPQPERR